MRGRGWWRPGQTTIGRAVAWALAFLMGAETSGCAGGSRVIPYRTNVSLISPWRYYDLWQALSVGRGVLVGTKDGQVISAKFLSGGAKTIRLSGRGGAVYGPMEVPISSIRYLINVIDLSQAREGAIAGGIIGFGAGLTLAYATGGTTSQPSSRPARALAEPTPRPARSAADDNQSSSGGDVATGNTQSTDSQSNANTTTGASNTEAGQSSATDATTGAQGASSESSEGGSSTAADPTQTGSTTYTEGGSSGGSSAGGTSTTTTTTQQSGQSSGNSTVIVNVGGETQGSSSRSNAGTRNDGQPQGGSSLAPAWRMFFFAVGFAALGTFVGWAIGRTKKKSTPRVDYVLFPANLGDQGARSPDQYLADQIARPSGEQPAATLLPGSRFDSPRSAMLFEQFAQGGTVIRLGDAPTAVITQADARAYDLFPTVSRFNRAVIVSCGASAEISGTECRYIAVVTSGGPAAPTVSLERLSARDVIRLGTQVNLIRAGIVR